MGQALSVAAAELVRNFAHWREVGRREPVAVTHHGRETHMLVGVDQYWAMIGDAPHGNTMPNRGHDAMRALATRMNQGFILCRADMRIDHANPVALAICGRSGGHLEGDILWQALPEWIGTLTETHFRHTLASGEPSTADIPSPFRPDSWLHVETFLLGTGVALLLRDISQDMRQQRLADRKAALLQAMATHGGVGHARLSMRGYIENADAVLCAMIGLPEERLVGVALADMLELRLRRHLRDSLEAVLTGQGDRRLETQFLNNDGQTRPVTLALSQLRGAYGAEGAVMVVTATGPGGMA